MPSAEASQEIMHNCTHAYVIMTERHSQYWASDHLQWKQLYFPWLSGFWSWFNWRIGDGMGVHWKEGCRNWAEKSVACNLVFLAWTLWKWLIKLLAGIAYPWTVLVPFYLQNFSSLVKELAKVSPKIFIPNDICWLGDFSWPLLTWASFWLAMYWWAIHIFL